MTLSRRQFLGAAAVGAAGGLAVPGLARAAAGTSYAVQGIDVSHYQGTVSWPGVRSAGMCFAFCKATEGTTYTDPTFATNWPQMKSAGLFRGAYHYGHPGTDAVAQANYFY